MPNLTEITGQFTFLGTGGSMGIPVIGCKCKICHSDSPCNHRLRPSGLITINGKNILIDCGPDFREQALKYHLDHLDGLIITHAHHDHIAGVDELRVYFMHHKKSLPCLLSPATAGELLTRYSYIFQEHAEAQKLTTKISLQILPEEPHGTTIFENIPIQFISYEQAGMIVNGLRFGDFAYLTDIRNYSEEIFDHLIGVKTLVVSALRFEPASPFHFTVDEAVAFSQKIGATHTWLTHIAHDLDHEETNSYLPANVRMAYDGLEIHF